MRKHSKMEKIKIIQKETNHKSELSISKIGMDRSNHTPLHNLIQAVLWR